jgi:hypothetical protein
MMYIVWHISQVKCRALQTDSNSVTIRLHLLLSMKVSEILAESSLKAEKKEDSWWNRCNVLKPVKMPWQLKFMTVVGTIPIQTLRRTFFRQIDPESGDTFHRNVCKINIFDNGRYIQKISDHATGWMTGVWFPAGQNFSLRYKVRTGSGDPTASNSIDTVVHSSAARLKLNTHLHLVPMLVGIGGATPPFHTSSCRGVYLSTNNIFTFNLDRRQAATKTSSLKWETQLPMRFVSHVMYRTFSTTSRPLLR